MQLALRTLCEIITSIFGYISHEPLCLYFNQRERERKIEYLTTTFVHLGATVIGVGDGDNDVMTVQTPTVGGTLDQMLPFAQY